MSYNLDACIADKAAFDKDGIAWAKLYKQFAITTEPVNIKKISRLLPIAKVRADYFGGFGEQYAEFAVNGKIKVFHDSHSGGAINGALAALGILREEGKDLFDTVGLGRHRDNDWIDNDLRYEDREW